MATAWSLCLVTTNGTNTSRKVVQVNPASDRITDLYRIAGEAFGVSQVQSLKAGFPPQVLDSNDSTTLSSSNKISNQERVQVVLRGDNNGTAPPTNDNNNKNNSSSGSSSKGNNKGRGNKSKATTTTTTPLPPNSSPSQSGRPKRAAAQAATDSFADVIRQQDRVLKAEKLPTAKKPRRGAPSVASKNNTTTSSDINKTRQQQRPKPNPKFQSQAPGRRLADGAVVVSPKSSSRSPALSTRKSPSLPAGQQKYEDLSAALLGALDDKGTMGRILRKGMSSHVQNSYESTKATTRLAALESRTPQTSVQMERVQNDAKLKVRFEKGVQGRGYFEEVVDWIPLDVLKQVIAAIYKSDPEGLRPHNLAFLSPRVLWTLAYCHWETQQLQQQQQEGPSSWQPFSIEEAYRKLLPDNDWSFLRRRKQTLSAKAMENLRQKSEENGENEAENYEKAADAIQEVENAMTNLHQYDRSQRADRVANAALTRQQKQQHLPSPQPAQQDAWEIVTPSELDEDELIECISTSISSENARDISILANGLVEWASIHNWRELANQHPIDLHTCIVDHAKDLNVSQEEVESWIGYAREQSIDEIILEICGGNTNHVELLRDKANAGTPKDLAVWKAMPDLLLEELGGEASDASLSSVDLALYCNRSSLALEQLEWLTWYATPVE